MSTLTSTPNTDTEQTSRTTIIRERRDLALGIDNQVYLFGSPIIELEPAKQAGFMVAHLGENKPNLAHVSLVDAADLFYVLTGEQEITLQQQELWLRAYVQARSAFAGIMDQLLLTSVGRVLPHRLHGGQEFLDTLTTAKEVLNTLPIDIQQGSTLYAACMVTSDVLTKVVNAYVSACLTTWLMTVSGGTQFFRAVEDLRTIVKQLPSLPTAQQDALSPAAHPVLPGSTQPEPSLSSQEQAFFLEQAKSRADEIQHDKESRRALLLKLLEYAGLFLSIGLANIANTGVIALAFPIIALFLMAEWRRDNDKIGLNRRYTRNRIERVVYQTNLPWEIYRSVISRLVELLRDAQKQERKATFEQLVLRIEPRARALLSLAPNEDIPTDILTEMQFAFQTPTNLLEFATRGVAIFMQTLTLVVGIASAVFHLLQAPASPQAWVIAVVAALFVAMDAYAIFQTWKIIKHIR